MHVPLTLSMIRKYCVPKFRLMKQGAEEQKQGEVPSESEDQSHAGDTTSISTNQHK